MQRILHLIWRFDGGGIETFCINLLKNVDNNKYIFDFVVVGDKCHGEDDEILSNSVIYHFPLIKGKFGKKQYIEELYELLNKKRYDVVHSHLAFMNISILRIAKKCGIPIRISHTHVAGMGKTNSLKNIIKRKLMNYYATSCIACSEKTKEFYYGLNAKKAIVLYSGVDVNKFYNKFPKNNNCFVVVSRVCPEKNPNFILDVAEKLIEKNPKLEFHWYGGGKDLPQLIENASKNNNPFVFHGEVSNIEYFLKDAAYMLMPSLKEGFGMAAVEAQLSGTYVFASNYVPKDTNIGMIEYYPLDSPENWANRIQEVIENNKSKKKCDKKHINNYDIKVISNIIFEIYRGIR